MAGTFQPAMEDPLRVNNIPTGETDKASKPRQAVSWA